MAEVPERMGDTTTGSVRTARAGAKPVAAKAVRVRAPARLHFGFLDMHGGLGRRFGSIGLALDTPAIQLKATKAARATATGPEAERILTYALAAASHLDVQEGAAFLLEETIPAHAGFGSGTQLALSVAAALACLHERPFSASDFAEVLDRGNRSGVGLAAFTEGGLIVDGGRDDSGAPPPVLTRLPWPDEWRIVLIVDSSVTGVHGTHETEAFRDLPRFDEGDAAQICRITLMQVLPSLVLRDLDGFGRGITAIQQLVGDHFAPRQGGRYASPAVAEILAAVAARGIAGYGQSSWGPTGFVLMPSERAATTLVAEFERPGPLRFIVARGRNQGAAVTEA